MEIKSMKVEIQQRADGSWYIDTDTPVLPTDIVNEILNEVTKIPKLSKEEMETFIELKKHHDKLQISNYIWFSIATFLFILLLMWR